MKKMAEVSKEQIKLDKADLDNLKTLDTSLLKISSQLALLEYEHWKKKQFLLKQIEQLQNQYNTSLSVIKRKYKIIKPIKNIDFDKGIIFL